MIHPQKFSAGLSSHTHTKNSQRERLDPFHVQLKCIDSYPFFLKKTNAIELCLIFLSLNQQDKRWLQRLSRDVVIASMGACLARAVDCRDAPCGCFQADGCCVSPRGLLGGWGVSGRVHVSSWTTLRRWPWCFKVFLLLSAITSGHLRSVGWGGVGWG